MMKHALMVGSCVAFAAAALAQAPSPPGPPSQGDYTGAPPAGLPPGGAPPPGAPPGGLPGGPPPGFPGAGPAKNVPTPRTKSGKPYFGGVWGHNFFSPGDKVFYPIGPVMPDVSMLKPWARDEYVRRWKALEAGDQIPNTSMLCMPAGAPSLMMEAHALQIIQTDKELMFLAESDHQVRIVYLDGKHPVNLLPSWYGDSIGHWEGDTMVMDTVGFNDKTQLDPMGTPHSAALHVMERMTFQKDGQIDDMVTLEDPLTLEHPWTYHYHYNSHSAETQTENVAEYACAENNKDGYVPPEPQIHSPKDL